MQGFCRPSGTRFLFFELTPDLGPGLMNAAPEGAELYYPYAALKRRSSMSLLAV